MDIVDNFLSESDFKNIEKEIFWNTDFPMYLYPFIASKELDKKIDNRYNWFGQHRVYDSHVPTSPFYNLISNTLLPKVAKLTNLKALLRIKVNFYPATPTIMEHAMHKDYKYTHKGALFSINTCNGYTTLKDGKKVHSVANRMLFHNPSIEHGSSSTTDAKGRWNININYI